MADSGDIQDSGQHGSERDIDRTKRRFLAGGLFAAPVVMTLTTRPVLARDLKPLQDPRCASITSSLAPSNPVC